MAVINSNNYDNFMGYNAHSYKKVRLLKRGVFSMVECALLNSKVLRDLGSNPATVDDRNPDGILDDTT